MRRIAWTPHLIAPLLGLTIGILLGMEIKGLIDDMRILAARADALPNAAPRR
jgi:hypothetical protein